MYPFQLRNAYIDSLTGNPKTGILLSHLLLANYLTMSDPFL